MLSAQADSVLHQIREDRAGFAASSSLGTGEAETGARSKGDIIPETVLESDLAMVSPGLSLYYLRSENDIGGERLGGKPSAFLFTLTSCRRKSARSGVRRTRVQIWLYHLRTVSLQVLYFSFLNLRFLICKMGHMRPVL